MLALVILDQMTSNSSNHSSLLLRRHLKITRL
jgi:hypothetical protein